MTYQHATVTRRRLQRSRDRRIVAGVAAGLGRWDGINPWWFRLGFLLLTPVGGLGIVLYLVGWVLIPEEDAPAPIAEQWVGQVRDGRAWVGAALIAVAVLVGVAAFDVFNNGVLVAAGLLILGVLLYRGQGETAPAPPKAPEPPADGEPGDDTGPAPGGASLAPAPDAAAVPDVPQPDGFEDGAPPPGEPPSAEPDAEPPLPSPVRRRSILGRITVATALITVGVMALLDNLDVASPAARHYVAAALLVVGAGLLVGAVVGRSRGLIALGLLLVPFVLAAGLVRVPLTGGFGDDYYRVTAVAEDGNAYRLVAGRLEVDLRPLELGSEPAEITATVAFGQLIVVVPPDVAIDARAEVGGGDARILGVRGNGVEVDERVVTGGEGSIVLRTEVGFGAIHIFRAEG